MKAELKGIHSPDIDDLSQYRPADAGNFGFLLQAMAGPKGQEGEESFDVMICTPKWLVENHESHEIIFGYHHIMVFEYDYSRIVGAIDKYVRGCTGDNWNEIATKLSRMGKWEFEDYVA